MLKCLEVLKISRSVQDLFNVCFPPLLVLTCRTVVSSAEPSSSMENVSDLEHEMLVVVMNGLDSRTDLQNAALACKTFRGAVKDAGVILRPPQGSTSEELLKLCQYRNAKDLCNIECTFQTAEAFHNLQNLIRALTQLEILSLVLLDTEVLPEEISSLDSLNDLTLYGCYTLRVRNKSV